MPNTTKEPKLRVERVGSLLQELLGPIIAEYILETNNLVTISRVNVSPDMRHAKVFLQVLNEKNDEAILKQLQNNMYDIQGEVNRQVKMKIIPRIEFTIDTSSRYAQHISEVLENLRENE